MPVYEYECQNCRHHFDILQKMNDDPLSECPDCKHHSLVRLVSAAGFQLKGTGWYVTDFKNKDKNPSASQKKSSETNAGTSDGTSSETRASSESKPDTKTEKKKEGSSE